ncbi:hypothetical protein MLD38_031420 [Melastoma candidum]|uniref:Uncharacterized protein n=1 Tax=Melastoma candidum TaxID=119954 RepID=A0ACB9MQ65_9MYRT|nr:hypothetical protein MLD38_031420 [Melastoma candidum]
MKALPLSFSSPFLTSISRQDLDLRSHQFYAHFRVHHPREGSFRRFSSPPSSESIAQLIRRRSHRGDASAAASNDGKVAVMSYEELVQKDYSFLEMGNNSPAVSENMERIVSAGMIDATSKVLVSFGSEEFMDKLAEPFNCQFLLVVHDSLFVLACIKEKYDQIKCWQGEVIYAPEKWAPFDVVFLYFLPGLPFALDSIFESLTSRCPPGARVVISHPLGRQSLEKQRKEFPECVVSNLPDKATLQKVAAKSAFEMADFVDEPGFYLAVLKYNGIS